MENAIEYAKDLVAKFLQGFPPDKVHVSVFNTTGREVAIKAPSAKAVEVSFRGIRAGGGTDYGAGVRALQEHKPKDDEDSLMLFVGDEEAFPFDQPVRDSGLRPTAFGFLKVRDNTSSCVRDTAALLGIPCFMVDLKVFDDAYAIPRTIRNLIAATPVGRTVQARPAARPRVSLVDTILKTDLLTKPAWAA
jgi:hypothetical protein